jgi:hypothetical protein
MKVYRAETRVDLFDESYRTLRVKLGIRDAATAALNDTVGPTTVTPVLGGYEIVCRGVLELSDDNESSFHQAARRVASKFKR